MRSVFHVAIDLLLAVAFFGPAFAQRRFGMRGAVVVALVPGSLIGAVGAVSLETSWGQRTLYGDWVITNADSLFLSAAIVLVAGVLGLALAGTLRILARRRRSRQA
jgi:hypothetical protein